MDQAIGEIFKQTRPLDSRTGRFRKDALERPPSTDSARRFSCVFLSTSVRDAVRLNHHLSAAGIRVYHAQDIAESEMLLAITDAKILLIDIDRTFELWPEILQRLVDLHPHVPMVVLTEQNEKSWLLIRPQFALDVLPKPAHLGDLLEAL
jgi:DNA-binding NtrC family response regulator